MFNRLKAFFSSQPVPPLPFRTDIHSHLIPEIDDGAESMEDAIAMILALRDAGYEKLITTPHCMPHRFDNDEQTIVNGLEKLRAELKHRGIAITVEAAAEYFFDETFPERVKQKTVLTFDDNAVLFELSYIHPPVNIDSVVFGMQSAGYVPVLAHPERYRYFHQNDDTYARLKSLGVRFQVNINSFAGHYGPQTKKTAHFLEQQGWIDYLGSDAHRLKQVKMLSQDGTLFMLQKVARSNPLRNAML